MILRACCVPPLSEMLPTMWLPVLLALLSSFSLAAPEKRGLPAGFATTNGLGFEVDDEPYDFVGTNAFWLGLLTTETDVDTTLRDISDAGFKVVRTWGFNAINASELPYALSSDLTYYQVWNSSEWVLNEGSQGLQRLDYVIQSAENYGVKVILTFTNNWFGYGGADLYLNWIIGDTATHDLFYTNPTVIASYQQYVATIVNRYKDSPAIFAWELMNEARCAGDLLGSSSACSAATRVLPNWYQAQSDFVRSLDPYHLITTGGEGAFYWNPPATYWYNDTLVNDFNYDGGAGEDFGSDIFLPNIDFGVYHMYPQTWYPELDYPGSNFSIEAWGNSWISEHAAAAYAANKPVIIEEFGLLGLENKTTIYPSWVQTALGTGHAIMTWQFGELDLTEGNRVIKYTDEIYDGASPNDGFAIYPNETGVWDLLLAAAQIQSTRST